MTGDEDIAARKQDLLRQGAYYRGGITLAREHIRQGLRPEAIWHHALDRAREALRSRVDGLLEPTGVTVASLAPYALSAVAMLRKRRMLKPGLAVAAAALMLGWAWRRRVP